MPDIVRVVPEDLHVSAATVEAHADTVHARHRAAEDRIDAAQPGLPLSSAAALSAAVTKWHTQTTAIFARMVEHSHGLRRGALAYQQTDSDSATTIDSAGEQVPEIDLGL